MTNKSGPKPKPKTELYKKISITLSPELWEAVETERREGEGTSALVSRLLVWGVKNNDPNCIKPIDENL